MKQIVAKTLALIFVGQVLATPVAADPPRGKGHGKHHGEKAEGRGKHRHKHQKKEKNVHHDEEWWRDALARTDRGRFFVPPGHRPAPGMCRIWYADLPPGQQPPPVRCSELRPQRDAYYYLYGDYGYDPAYDWTLDREAARLRDLPHELLDALLDRVGVPR